MAFRFGHSQVQHEFRPWINGKRSGFPGTGPDKLPNGGEHAFWLLHLGGFFEKPEKFITNDDGKGWLNEVEGLINQKCPEVDLRIENVLSNDLFSRHRDGGVAGRLGGICNCRKKRLKRNSFFSGNEDFGPNGFRSHIIDPFRFKFWTHAINICYPSICPS